jgi:hypothetical protein
MVQRLHNPFVTAAALDPRDMWQPVFVLATFLTVQVLDGVLTYWGVRQFGLHVEANALVATVIQLLGVAPAMVATKSFACLCGLILHITSSHRPLAVAAGGYIGVAVFPWVMLLSTGR